jgi:hypothetical protein
MNKVDFTQGGGFPLSEEVMSILQTANANCFKGLAGIVDSTVYDDNTTDAVILSGTVSNNEFTSNGYLKFNGEVLPFQASIGTNAYIIEESTYVTFEDGQQKPVIKNRYVMAKNSGGTGDVLITAVRTLIKRRIKLLNSYATSTQSLSSSLTIVNSLKINGTLNSSIIEQKSNGVLSFEGHGVNFYYQGSALLSLDSGNSIFGTATTFKERSLFEKGVDIRGDVEAASYGIRKTGESQTSYFKVDDYSVVLSDDEDYYEPELDAFTLGSRMGNIYVHRLEGLKCYFSDKNSTIWILNVKRADFMSIAESSSVQIALENVYDSYLYAVDRKYRNFFYTAAVVGTTIDFFRDISGSTTLDAPWIGFSRFYNPVQTIVFQNDKILYEGAYVSSSSALSHIYLCEAGSSTTGCAIDIFSGYEYSRANSISLICFYSDYISNNSVRLSVSFGVPSFQIFFQRYVKVLQSNTASLWANSVINLRSDTQLIPANIQLSTVDTKTNYYTGNCVLHNTASALWPRVT